MNIVMSLSHAGIAAPVIAAILVGVQGHYGVKTRNRLSALRVTVMAMTDADVEAVARAMYEALAELPNYRLAGWDHLGDDGKDLYRHHARTAISALKERGLVVVPREPTAEMSLAGCEAVLNGIGGLAKGVGLSVNPVWAAMIEAVDGT